jgi:hypothetical protein
VTAATVHEISFTVFRCEFCSLLFTCLSQRKNAGLQLNNSELKKKVNKRCAAVE